MKNNNMQTPEEKLNAAVENFEILKDNLDNFSIREQLEMASSIRDNLSTDESVKAACNNNSILSEKRNQLLDGIHIFQMNLILEYRKKDEDISFSTYRVIDFDKAKTTLSEMIDKELASNMFSEHETPSINDKIEACKTHIETLNRISSNCKYGKYKVLIMGDFQSGKSTTLDAFCDGRHICAIGKGAATSAVLVSATYAEKESFIIHWRQKDHFYTIFEKIKHYLQDFDWNSFDLANANSRKQLLGEIEVLRKSKNCPKIGEGNAKFLMLSSFVLRYYDTVKLEKKKSSLQNISEISEITKFPDKGESIWEKTGIDNFSVDDVIFIFIDYVECFIPSNTLKELNCTLIDSPGLFNSSYDTMVTENAMKEAHAILYILPYYKGIGMDNCKSLYTIKNNYADVHRKLFIVNNLILTDDNDFYESNCRQIESMFGPDKHVYPYDGKLAYLTQLKKLYLSGLATEKDYKHLMTVEVKGIFREKEKKTFETFNDAWVYHTKKYEVTGTSIEKILEKSGFKVMTKALKAFIAHNESYAVIVSNGLAPMRHELVSVENSLNNIYIEPYFSSHDNLVKLWKKRIDLADDFQKYVRSTAKEKLFNSQGNSRSLLERMAEDEYQKLFTYDFFTRLSKEISGVLYDNKSSLLGTKTLFKKDKAMFKKRFSELSSPWILDKIIELVNEKIKYLVDNMEREQDKTVENMFVPNIKNLENELSNYWKSKMDEGISMNDFLLIPRNLKLSESNHSGQATYNSNTLSGNNVSGTLLGGLIAQVTAVVTGLASMIAGYITAIMCDPFGGAQTVTFILAVLLGIGGVIIETMAPDAIRNKFIQILSKKIDSDVRTNSVEGFKIILKTHLENTFNKYVNNLSVNIIKLKNERDLALTPSPNQESLCFRALEVYTLVHNQITTYDEFNKVHLKDEAI